MDTARAYGLALVSRYDLDSKSQPRVLSSKKWGLDVFQRFFERIVLQCAEAGLIDGHKIFVDSSLVDANASNSSVLDTRNLKHQLHKNYKKLEARLEERTESTTLPGHRKKNNRSSPHRPGRGTGERESQAFLPGASGC
jgi:hypothetical protein